MKEKIGKLLGLICLVGLLTANVSVFAWDTFKKAPEGQELEGPDYSGHRLNFDRACCERAAPQDKCADAWGAC